MQRILTFFQQKNKSVFVILPFEIFKSFINDVVDFEQLAPAVLLFLSIKLHVVDTHKDQPL